MALSMQDKRKSVSKFLKRYKSNVKEGVSGAANLTKATAKSMAAFPFAFLGTNKNSRAFDIGRRLVESSYKDIDKALKTDFQSHFKSKNRN